uniref:Peptidase A2 domain-containing protein n=1 Tax=Cyprinus carpio TaxID=7962 RepID=A0A8C2DC19_CYPCA
MFRSSSPAVHGGNLSTWLKAVTTPFLPKDASNLQHLNQEQLDTEPDELMAHDPTQSYNYKELARILGSLVHILVTQARLSEWSNIDLEQQAATLMLQAEEAWKDQARTQSRLDQLLLETQNQPEKEDATDPELQKEVERLQNALQDLRLDTDQRGQLEREAQKELNEKLQQCDTLLERAKTELKERDSKARACEKHLQAARAKIDKLTLQRDELQDELDTVHAELKHSYRLQSGWNRETHTIEFLPARHSNPFSQEPRAEKGGVSPRLKTSPASFQEHLSATEGGEPFQRTHATKPCTAPRELDKLARNIPTFNPDPAGGHDVHAYLQDIDFHLQTVANVTALDKLYLLRITSRRDVHRILDRQPETVKVDYQQLRKTLILEFSDPDSDHGLLNAMDLKQGRLENPQTFYSQLRKAYFGARNEPGMEQDVNFKTLFLRNLHASWSFHLGVSACPCSMSTQESWDLAHKAYTKQKTISEKTVKNPTIYSVSEHCSELTLEGAPQHHSHRPFYRESRPFQASRGLHNRGGARPKHQSKRYERFWDRRPKKSRSPPSRTQSPDSRQWNHSRHDTGKLNPEHTSEKHRAATSETAEILRVLKELLYMKTRKEDKKDEPDILCLSIRTETNTLSNCHLTEPSTPNTARHPQTTELTVTSQGDSITQAPQLTAAHPERDSTVPHTRYHNPKVPENAVLATCLRSELHETGPNHPSIITPAPMPTFLGNLVEKGVGRKLHLNITLGKGVSMEALIDTGSDLTVISSQHFKRFQFAAKRQDPTLTPRTCELNVQSYRQAYQLGWLLSHDFHDFELVLPVIGPIPPALIPEGRIDNTLFTAPFKFIAITSVMSVTKDQVCRTELTEDQHLAVYTVSHQSVGETDEPATPLNTKPTDDTPMEEPYPGFESPVQRILQDANALQSDTVRQGLRQVLYEFKESCAKYSLDCGLTTLHMVRIPTHPDAPPTFVKQYKIPIASHEPVQEMIESMLEKGVIRPRNSTYSAPIWPVLKPNGEWRPTINYRKLNQQVPLSQLPMTQLEQEIPRIRGATIFSTLDVASGFWTIPVHLENQHKLAFTFGNRQFPFNRCPFGYANSPAEFNIFLNKACTDSNYARLSFVCHLPSWKQNGFKTANNKPVKHQHLFQERDNITKTHNVTVYWKKVKGHSKLPSLDKDLNDQTDTLAKTGALNNRLWSLPTHPPTFKVKVITHSIRTLQTRLPTSEPLTLAPLFTNTNIADKRVSDTSIKTLLNHLSNPSIHPCTLSTLTDNQCLRPLHDTKHMLRAQNNTVGCAPSDITMLRLVMPRRKRGIMPMYFQDASCAAQRSTRATDETLKQESCQQQDVAKHGPRRAKPSRRPRSK